MMINGSATTRRDAAHPFIHIHSLTHSLSHSLSLPPSLSLSLSLSLSHTHVICIYMHAYQVLPINDSGEDPSPYSASSSFALHPIYVRPREVAEYYQDKLSDKDLEGLIGWSDTAVAKLNKSWKVMHASVMAEKDKLMNAIFDKVGLEAVMADEGIRAWAAEQSSWLKTYAAFKVQLEKERGYNNKWWDCTTWRVRAADADAIAAEKAADWPQVARV